MGMTGQMRLSGPRPLPILGGGWPLPFTVKRLVLVDLEGIDTKANDEAVPLLDHEIAVVVVERGNPPIEEAFLPEHSSKGERQVLDQECGLCFPAQAFERRKIEGNTGCDSVLDTTEKMDLPSRLRSRSNVDFQGIGYRLPKMQLCDPVSTRARTVISLLPAESVRLTVGRWAGGRPGRGSSSRYGKTWKRDDSRLTPIPLPGLRWAPGNAGEPRPAQLGPSASSGQPRHAG